MNPAKILVAFGGVSPEHEVSVISGIQAAMSLKENGTAVLPLYITKHGVWLTGESLLELSSYKDLKNIHNIAKSCSILVDTNGIPALQIVEKGFFAKPTLHPIKAILLAFHGSDGENGAFQGLCEQYNIAYSGSPVMASAIGMDKDSTKRLCREAGIPTVPGISFWESEWVAAKSSIVSKLNSLGFPLFVKPARLGSSIGVAKAMDEISLKEAIETAFRYDSKLVVEKAIQPLKEINCSVLGTAEENRPSVCEQPRGSSELLSFKDKYQANSGGKGMASASRLIPAPISDEKTKEIQDLSCKIFSLLGCAGVARLDFLVNEETEEVYFNEINTIPGSLAFYLWEKTGLRFSSLVQELVDIAIKAHQQKNGRVRSYETNLLSEKSAKGLKGLKGLKK